MSRYWHWGTKIALVYCLFVTGTITMVAIAVNQRTDLVTPDYYAKALRQDDRMEAVRNTVALGSSFSAVQRDSGALTIAWPHTPDSGTITLYRASDAGADREIPVSPVAAAGGAQQRVDLTMLAEGAWKAQIAWTAHGQSYYAEREIAIK